MMARRKPLAIELAEKSAQLEIAQAFADFRESKVHAILVRHLENLIDEYVGREFSRESSRAEAIGAVRALRLIRNSITNEAFDVPRLAKQVEWLRARYEAIQQQQGLGSVSKVDAETGLPTFGAST